MKIVATARRWTSASALVYEGYIVAGWERGKRVADLGIGIRIIIGLMTRAGWLNFEAAASAFRYGRTCVSFERSPKREVLEKGALSMP